MVCSTQYERSQFSFVLSGSVKEKLEQPVQAVVGATGAAGVSSHRQWVCRWPRGQAQRKAGQASDPPPDSFSRGLSLKSLNPEAERGLVLVDGDLSSLCQKENKVDQNKIESGGDLRHEL